jgi:hypothetical protein
MRNCLIILISFISLTFSFAQEKRGSISTSRSNIKSVATTDNLVDTISGKVISLDKVAKTFIYLVGKKEFKISYEKMVSPPKLGSTLKSPIYKNCETCKARCPVGVCFFNGEGCMCVWEHLPQDKSKL